MKTEFGRSIGWSRIARLGGTLLVALVLFLAGTLVSRRPVGADEIVKKDNRRSFYLTPLTYDGSQALNACVAGYHMASIYEILDPSNLRYDTTLGVTADDSGSGPPQLSNRAWIRTGGAASGVPTAGVGNCNAWTDNSVTNSGTIVTLHPSWDDPTTFPSRIQPWLASTALCAETAPVWCVQD